MKLEDEIKHKNFPDELLKCILNILVTADRISNVTNAALKPFGLSKEQFNVLRILRGQHPKPSTIQNIQSRMISKSSNATRLVEKMRVKGWVERALCASDRRRVDVLITQRGLDLLDELDPLVKNAGEAFRNITDEETRELNRLLDKLRG